MSGVWVANVEAVTTTGLKGALTNLNNSTKGTDLEKDIEKPIGAIIKGVLSLVGTIFLILTVYAGLLWMTAQGKDESVEKATKILKASIIGIFIIISAYAITYFVTSKLGG